MWPFRKSLPVETQSNEVVPDVDRGFGIFAPLLEGLSGEGPSYMDLLHLDGPKAGEAVSLVMKCCALASNPYRDVRRLLHQSNWRPHLVAAVAMATLVSDPETNHELWAAIDAGSWVTPQLAVVAFLRDPMFADRARERLRSGCRVRTSRAAGLVAAERHSSTGPGGPIERSAKTAASLVALLGHLPHPVDWLIAEVSAVDTMKLLDRDIDSSGLIADRWFRALNEKLFAWGRQPDEPF